MIVGWVDTETVQDQWAQDTPDEDTLIELLQAAYAQCLAFAPTPDPLLPFTPPANYRMAQVMQAKALYRSMNAGSNDGIGPEGLSVTVFPMDWTVKALLRPKRAVPVMG